MTRRTPQGWATIVGCAALGAAAMYVLDPTKGRRRRAIASDKLRSFVADAGSTILRAAHDAQFRIRGLQARGRWLTHRGDTPDELKVIERVRAKLGRVCSHPHAIQVGANHGRVTLSGPILASEVRYVLDAVGSTRDVAEVEDRLVRYDRSGSVPSLQGGIARPDGDFGFLQEGWTPALCVAAVAGGGALAFAGMRRGGFAGVALATLGVAVAARGLTARPVGDCHGEGMIGATIT